MNWMFHWMKNMDVRYDPEDILEELKKYAEEKEEEILNLDEEERNEIGYSIWDYKQDIDHPDIAQRRHTMNQFFDFLIEQTYILDEQIPVKQNYRIEKLQDFDGYMYKLAQDYLTSSSTLERKQKLENMAEHIRKRVGNSDIEFETDKESFGL